jgi:hypothetical protein
MLVFVSAMTTALVVSRQGAFRISQPSSRLNDGVAPLRTLPAVASSRLESAIPQTNTEVVDALDWLAEINRSRAG